MHVKAVCVALILASGAAFAQGSASFTATGTVDAVGPASIAVKNDADGVEERFALAPNLLVVQAKPATLADIQPGDFVASAAVPGQDGKLRSTELRIFPAAMRGVGEGQRPMNDFQGQTMTNATVTGAAVANGSNTLAVTFPGGQSQLIVDPGVPVTRLDVADRALVVPGARVRVQGNRGPEGAAVTRITLQ